jgi:hypothetical protein
MSAAEALATLQAEMAALVSERNRYRAALQAFVERGAKLSAFPSVYSPWVGELVNARAALREKA